jgi:nucleoside-diphosphate-sugar epimerase
MPAALVTGATGLVGSHIVDRLIADGYEVRALVRKPSADLPKQVDQRMGDILDLESFAGAARGCVEIFHTAAAVTPPGGWEAFRRPNIDGTANAIVAAEKSGARLLQVSSVAVYGAKGRYRADGEKTDENSPLTPLPDGAFYARSKRESEQMVMAAHRERRIWATAVRPDVIYGIRDRQFVPRVGRILRTGFMPLANGGHSTLAIVHAAHVADGAVLAVRHDGAAGRAYNLANDFDVTVRQFFELGAQGLGKRVRLIPIPMFVAQGALGAVKLVGRIFSGGKLSVVSGSALARDNPFTSERARRELGWSPWRRPEESIPEAFHWWLTHR